MLTDTVCVCVCVHVYLVNQRTDQLGLKDVTQWDPVEKFEQRLQRSSDEGNTLRVLL